MKTLFLRLTLVFAVIFILPLGLFAETNTGDGAALNDSIMSVSSYDVELQTDGQNHNYGACYMVYYGCLYYGWPNCYHNLNACLAGCDIDSIDDPKGRAACYQEE